MLNIAKTAARNAGDKILRSMDRLEHIEIIEKEQNDFVTEVDKLSEKEILFHLRKAFPSHAILSEESGEINNDNSEDYCWIIDPIDGTANFMRGFPHFCISIALQHKGRIELGVIFDPVRDEMFTAERGKGARLNEHRIRVGTTQKIGRALVATGFPYCKTMKNSTERAKLFSKILSQASGVRMNGSAALDLAYVACGRLDGYWESNLQIWDSAAGQLLVKEAGGYVTDFSGGDDYFKTGEIIAATPKIYPFLFNA